MIERQIIWNKLSKSIDDETEVHEYRFLIINEQREIDNKIQLIRESLMPIRDEEILDSGFVPGTKSRIAYKLIYLKSTKSMFETSKIYSGKWKRDSRLDDRIITIENYPQKWIS